MGNRFAILIAAAALGAAVIAAGASATFRSVDDPRGDTRCFHEATPPAHRPCSDSTKRNAEIVGATAGHEGRWLKHTIRVVGKFRHGLLLINTDQGAGCDFVLFIPGSAVRECDGSSARTGRARYEFHLHSVEVFFSKGSIGFPRHYGWSALADAGSPAGHAVDFIPKRDAFRPATYSDRDLIYIRHQLTASAGVAKYGTYLTIARDRARFYHGHVISAVRKCEVGRLVTLFKQRPGPDRELGTSRSALSPRIASWGMIVSQSKGLQRGDRIYAKAIRKERSGYVCRADRSQIRLHLITAD